MFIISLAEAAELKRIAGEKFAVSLHFHDSCGGQYFSLDEPADAGLMAWLSEYAEGKKLRVLFSEDGLGFYLVR